MVNEKRPGMMMLCPSGHRMVQVKWPFACFTKFAFIMMGSMMSAEQHQATSDATRDTNGVRYLGDDM